MLLPDCTLFPHGGLPLHIFEPRYRRMLEESLEGDCFFAIGRLLGAEIGIEPVISVFAPENQSIAAMKTLRGAVEDAVRPLPQEVQDGVFALIDRADDPGLMTDIICQQFIHEANLRQELLEMHSVGDRIPVICEYLRNASLVSED